MAHRFTVIFEKEDQGGYHVFCPTLAGCHTQSETIEEGEKNIRVAIELYVENLIDDGLLHPLGRQIHQIDRDFRVTPRPPTGTAKDLVRVAEPLGFLFRRQT
jgi:predicted RNase H-like HicB family nuclease